MPSAPTPEPLPGHPALGDMHVQTVCLGGAGGSPEPHLPSRGPAAQVEVGRSTGGAAGWSPRAGGGGETQPGEAEKGWGVPPPLHVPGSLNPQGPRSALRPNLRHVPPSPHPPPLPAEFVPALSPGLPGKGRLCSQAQPSPSRPHAALGDDPSSLQSRRPWSRVTLVTPGTPVSYACAQPAGLQGAGAFFSHRLLLSSLHLGGYRASGTHGSVSPPPCAGGPFPSRCPRLIPLRLGRASRLNRRRSSHPCASPVGSLGWPALAE